MEVLLSRICAINSNNIKVRQKTYSLHKQMQVLISSGVLRVLSYALEFGMVSSNLPHALEL